ncbi:MAG TPA: hypothetical protein DCL54_07755 [Alphaproteobacteria bacterium]|nr:hypothetical protein [Alphaproteobacteria bacterium]
MTAPNMAPIATDPMQPATFSSVVRGLFEAQEDRPTAATTSATNLAFLFFLLSTTMSPAPLKQFY